MENYRELMTSESHLKGCTGFHMTDERERVPCRERTARVKAFRFLSTALLTSCFVWGARLALAFVMSSFLCACLFFSLSFKCNTATWNMPWEGSWVKSWLCCFLRHDPGWLKDIEVKGMVSGADLP